MVWLVVSKLQSAPPGRERRSCGKTCENVHLQAHMACQDYAALHMLACSHQAWDAT